MTKPARSRAKFRGRGKVVVEAHRIPSRTFGYCRVSSDTQAEEGQSLEQQQEQLAGWAQMKSVKIDRFVIEAGISGSMEFAKRPQGQALLAELQAGDVLAVTKLDRFSRNLLDCLHVSQELQRRGVHLYLLDVHPSDPCTGNGVSRMYMQMLGVFAEFERGRIALRIQEAKARSKAAGVFSGGSRQFGYEKGKKGQPLVPRAEEQRAIRRIHQLARKGLSSYAIRDTLLKESDGSIKVSHVTVSKLMKESRSGGPGGR